MGTRGLMGFRKDGTDKLTYNHWDSYPTSLGRDVLKALKKTNIKTLNKVFDSIKLVSENEPPTKKQIKELLPFANAGVSTGRMNEWYVLLREAQGNMGVYTRGELKYMSDSSKFIQDSLFCEWAYIVNLDTKMLEVWKGWQKKRDTKNRYGFKTQDSGYYPCKLIKEYKLSKLPSIKTFVNDTDPEDD